MWLQIFCKQLKLKPTCWKLKSEAIEAIRLFDRKTTTVHYSALLSKTMYTPPPFFCALEEIWYSSSHKCWGKCLNNAYGQGTCVEDWKHPLSWYGYRKILLWTIYSFIPKNFWSFETKFCEIFLNINHENKELLLIHCLNQWHFNMWDLIQNRICWYHFKYWNHQ